MANLVIIGTHIDVSSSNVGIFMMGPDTKILASESEKYLQMSRSFEDNVRDIHSRHLQDMNKDVCHLVEFLHD